MAQTFDVKVLTEKEWQRLVSTDPPCEHVDEASWGYAIPETRTLRVRNTKVDALNKYLLSHEWEHLMEDEASDVCEHGVRHKKFFKQVVAPIALPILGGLLGGPIGAGALGAGGAGLGAGLASGIGTALGAAGGGALGAKVSGGDVGKSALISGALGAATPLIGKALQGLGGGQGASQGAKISGPAPIQPIQGARISGAAGPQAVQTAAGSSLVSPASRLAGGIRGPLQTLEPLSKFALQPLGQVPAQGTLNITGSLAGGLGGGGGVAGGGGGGGGFFAGITKKAGDFLKQALPSAAGQAGTNFLSNALQGGSPGFDLSAAAALAALGESRETPQVPNFSDLPSIQRVQQAANQGFASDIGRVATTRLGEQLTAPFTGLPSEVTSAISSPFRRREAQTRSAFKQFQPGVSEAESTGPTNLSGQLQDISREESETLALATQRERERFENLRRQDLQLALGVDENTLNQLFDLAQLDAQQIALQAGIDFGMAQQFKQTMGQLAGLFATRGLGLNRFELTAPSVF